MRSDLSFLGSMILQVITSISNGQVQRKAMLPASVVVQCSTEVIYIIDAFTASNHLKNLPGTLQPIRHISRIVFKKMMEKD
jgi:hypothetical protein